VEVTDAHVITNTGYVTKGSASVIGLRSIRYASPRPVPRVSSRFDSFDRKRTVAFFRSRKSKRRIDLAAGLVEEV
jgi:urease beta subunit